MEHSDSWFAIRALEHFGLADIWAAEYRAARRRDALDNGLRNFGVPVVMTDAEVAADVVAMAARVHSKVWPLDHVVTSVQGAMSVLDVTKALTNRRTVEGFSVARGWWTIEESAA